MAWYLLRLGTKTLGHFGVGTFWGLGTFFSWDVLVLGRFIGGTLCSGAFCSWNIFRLEGFVFGRFVGVPKITYFVCKVKYSCIFVKDF